jgi:hypothetical protein
MLDAQHVDGIHSSIYMNAAKTAAEYWRVLKQYGAFGQKTTHPYCLVSIHHILSDSCYTQGSSQGIFACRAGTCAPPAGMHETKKILLLSYFLKIFISCFMHVSLFKTCRNA